MQGGTLDADMSIYGDTFADEPGGLALSHNRSGLLSMASGGEGSFEALDVERARYIISITAIPLCLSYICLSQVSNSNKADVDVDNVVILFCRL